MRSRLTKKTPTNSPATIDSDDAASRRLLRQRPGSGALLLTNQHDRDRRERDPQRCHHRQPLTEGKACEDRDGSGKHRRQRRDDAHWTECQRSIEEGDAAATGKSSHGAPGDIDRVDDRLRQQGQGEQQKDQAGRLRDNDSRHCGCLARSHPPQKIRRPVSDGGQKR